MPAALSTFEAPGRLRQSALSRLTQGLPPGCGNGRRSAQDALSVLYELASSPNTAADALAVLHELQVHQVELDVQQEELGQACTELEQALARQSALVEHAPVAYLTLDTRGVLQTANAAGAQLLGRAAQELPGQPLAMFLQAGGIGPLHALLAAAQAGAAAPARCELPLRAAAGKTCPVQAIACADSIAGQVLLVLVPVLASMEASIEAPMLSPTKTPTPTPMLSSMQASIQAPIQAPVPVPDRDGSAWPVA